MKKRRSLIPIEQIERSIYLIRGHRVMFDADLARIYGVTTARLNQQVKRNKERFPRDFMFQLTDEEFQRLILQFATSNPARGGRRKRPNAFTEHGAIMLASVLNTPVAVRASIQVVRAFIRLRVMLTANKVLARRLAELERKLGRHDGQIRTLFEAIRQLMTQPEIERRKIGFHIRETGARYVASSKEQ
jgi:hypothetical protein